MMNSKLMRLIFSRQVQHFWKIMKGHLRKTGDNFISLFVIILFALIILVYVDIFDN